MNADLDMLRRLKKRKDLDTDMRRCANRLAAANIEILKLSERVEKLEGLLRTALKFEADKPKEIVRPNWMRKVLEQDQLKETADGDR